MDSPVTFDPDQFRVGAARFDALSSLFRELEFWGLLKALQAESGATEDHAREPVTVLEELSSCEDLTGKIATAGEVAVHCELSGADPLRTELLGLGVCAGPQKPCYLPGRSWITILKD